MVLGGSEFLNMGGIAWQRGSAGSVGSVEHLDA